ncbi:hypothetical protein Syun_010631 [Stephania yunnanensis]|uniref:Protein kinase domain-containing protein n=1 Tax=Stephania yunnanensis TaxID=152371 RepID=A0AAP0KGV8_9MAGN
MPLITRNLSFSFTIFLLLFLITTALSIDDQGLALLSWKNTLSSSTDSLKTWTSTDPNPCNWFGITCNSNGDVVHITLKALDLQGPLPTYFQSLKFLETLVISSTNLSGPIPPEIGSYQEMRFLDLSSNAISGEIPVEVCRLTKLQSLSLSSNSLEGEIPSEIGNLSSLVYLTLFDNRLSGEIPKSIGRLGKLEIFRVGGNQNLNGELPWEIGNCSNLVVLGVAETSITGSIPASVGLLKNLQTIAMYTSLLSGPIPEEIANCTELQNLYLYQNSISGSIPKRIGELKKLQSLLIWQNNLVGTIPDELGSCSELTVIDLSENMLSGSIPRSLGELRLLQELQLSVNQLSGVVPPEITNCTALTHLSLTTMALLVGEIPPSISRCDNLQYLDLHSNGLSGSMPETLPESLQFVDISDNRLTGSLPVSIGSLGGLTKLLLGKNRLSGTIPSELMSCSKLQLLDLGDNGFSGEIPKELGMISSLGIALNLSCNRFTGEIPVQFSGLDKLGILDLSHNNLVGNVNVLASLQNLVALNISYNDFSGELPNTQFFKKIPLRDLTGNPSLYISRGGVAGHVPLGTTAHSKSTMKLAMSMLISASAVLLLLAIYMLVRAQVGKSGSTTDDKWEMTLYQKLDFIVDDIVQNLTSANVIGTGSSGVVYKVPIPNGETLAVKKMWSAEESSAFESEIRTLGSIRHKNIVRLLGWCSNQSMKLLLYDYLPNGSLSALLHGGGKGATEWEARYEVVLGVAHALAYLHHDCVPPILHGDVKAMNVLLGSRFEPCLADFGLARLVNSDGGSEGYKQSFKPQLAGSYGYMAPEHASMQRITEKSDVYSYGVVLMEVLTGRHPLDPTLPGGSHLVQWVRDHFHSKKNLVDILDSKLQGRPDIQIHEMLQTLAVSLLCVSLRAHDRPTMKDVVAMLKEIRHRDSARMESDPSKSVSTDHSPSPARHVALHGSSNCSFAFSDDSMCTH